MRIAAIILTGLTAISFAPLVSVLLASTLADALGCRLDESAIFPCPLGSLDLGAPLAVAAMLGWFMLVTWPGMILSLLGWAILGIVAMARRRRTTAS